MKKRKYRKATPQPPHHAWLDNLCWNCKNYNNCRNCGKTKKYVAEQKEHIKREEKNKIHKGDFDTF